MRALFILLLTYFLTGILQVEADHTFTTKDIGFTEGTDTSEIGCMVSTDFGWYESILEKLEDNDNKTLAFKRVNTAIGACPENTYYLGKRTITAVFKPILILHTNLPPPASIA